ncbi:MAG: hypothetical protein KKF27_21920, partial [Gammaproteobacteria bacterium]|nr:hypothetical protein [Gammaproteobacteria bacterium]MBU2685909.1 hypothetical protein [Gammaproteobacteria bacterium]
MSNAYLFAQSVVHSDLSLWSEWQVVPYGGEYDKGTSARIQHVDGREIIIDMETWGRRSNAASTNIDGNYPRHFDGSTWSKDNKPEIGVNPSRPAEDISKAIAKRFLPTYTEFYELAVKETEERKRLHDEAVARL